MYPLSSLKKSGPDDHESIYDLNWLSKMHHPQEQDFRLKKQFWGAELSKQLPIVDYNDVLHSDHGLEKWLQNLDVYGIGFVDNTPVTVKDTEALINRICFIRQTHYGGFWDFTANLEHGDTAYTSLALPGISS
jgi:trimethyllysine dioxygenase